MRNKKSEKKTRDRIGNRLRKLRLEKCLTGEAVAEMAGTSMDNYYRLERGEQSPTVETLEKVAEALGTQAYKLIEE